MNTTKKLFDLTDKVAIITGANGLLGKEHAIALSDMGCKLVLTDINLNTLNEKDYKTDTLLVKLDVSSKESWENVKNKR